jgi:4-hydroxy 2-oxovalerate aldolase
MAEILDCTIRDGSYVINSQWTPEQVENIVRELSNAGLKYIEVGNGIGLGSFRKGVKSLCTDTEYVALAAKNKGSAKIGTFFIPGVGVKEDINMLKENGGDFIRVGSDVSRSDEVREYIEYAKSLNLEAFCNFMKSYVVSPYELCKRAIRVQESGADTISLVDSAGGMVPRQVGKYIKYLKQAIKTKIGFHGHNNLLLANANNIAALETGADIIDCTLMGMGRGAGNAQTETMVVIMNKIGFDTGIDPMQLCRISKNFIEPLTSKLKGSNELQLVLGYAQFHDSYLVTIEHYALKYNIHVESLIIEVSKINKENPSEELIETVARQLQQGPRVSIFFPKFCHKEVR